jgi:hypothetical protein
MQCGLSPKPRFLVLTLACGFSTTALAQELTAEQRAAYKPGNDIYSTGAALVAASIACLQEGSRRAEEAATASLK